MIDDDDNYYDISDEYFVKIQKTGKRIFDAPVFMQKVKMPATNPHFIQVGSVGFRDTNETKAIFMRRTKELEDGYRQMLDNFTKAIAPDIYEKFLMYKNAEENYEQFIAAQTAEKNKKIERLKKKYQREIDQIEKEYSQKIEFINDMLLKKQQREEK